MNGCKIYEFNSGIMSEWSNKQMKISIIGYSGSGKSTLAEYLSGVYKIPVLFLDTVQFTKGWVERNVDEGNAIVDDFLKNREWVIDGNYSKYRLERRLSESDIIIIMLFGRIQCLLRAVKRYKMFKGKTRKSMATGCIEKMDAEFVRWILFDGRNKKKKNWYRSVIEKYSGKTVVLKNQKELDIFMQSVKSKNILNS
jgi:adenylate kinase family enzyme